MRIPPVGAQLFRRPATRRRSERPQPLRAAPPVASAHEYRQSIRRWQRWSVWSGAIYPRPPQGVHLAPAIAPLLEFRWLATGTAAPGGAMTEPIMSMTGADRLAAACRSAAG